MTYFGFLLRFITIPILIIFILTWRSINKPFWIAVLIHVFLAIVYTTPWDNYLVATRVWYYNPRLVSGIVFGYVPLEEYTFFCLQTLFVGLWCQVVVRRVISTENFKPSRRLRYMASAIAAVIWLGAAFIFLSHWKTLTYLSIILFWAIPPMIPQLLFGADILWYHRKLLVWTILPIGLYLSVVDSLAIKSGTWMINPEQSTDILIGNLPLEEAIFFFVTVAIVSFGITLLMKKESWSRRAEIPGFIKMRKRVVN